MLSVWNGSTMREEINSKPNVRNMVNRKKIFKSI